MSVYVECKPDEMLAITLGVPRREVEHAAGSGGVCSQLAKHNGVIGMLDEDPNSAQPSYLKLLAPNSWEYEIRVLMDKERNNRVILICPFLESWVVATAKSGGFKMTDFGFESDNGVKLHGEINQRLPGFKRLLEELVRARNPRILRLQALLTG